MHDHRSTSQSAVNADLGAYLERLSRSDARCDLGAVRHGHHRDGILAFVEVTAGNADHSPLAMSFPSGLAPNSNIKRARAIISRAFSSFQALRLNHNVHWYAKCD